MVKITETVDICKIIHKYSLDVDWQIIEDVFKSIEHVLEDKFWFIDCLL
jgi:hypothetical protein